MSDVIDLTRNTDDGRRSERSPQQGQRQRRRTSRPSRVFVVIHDKEPQDSGSDHNRSAFLPSRQDTVIVGIFYEYDSAARAAGEYVRDTFDIYEDEEEEGGDGGNDDDSDEESIAPLSHIDWRSEGWFRQEESDANECDDRVHIMEERVS